MLGFSLALILVLWNVVNNDAAPAYGIGVLVDTTEVLATFTVVPTSNHRTLDPTIGTSTSTGTTTSTPNATSPISVDPTLDSTTLALTTAGPTTPRATSSSSTTSDPTTPSLTTMETSTSGSSTSVPSTAVPTTLKRTTIYATTIPYTSTSAATTSGPRTNRVSTTSSSTVVPPKGSSTSVPSTAVPTTLKRTTIYATTIPYTSSSATTTSRPRTNRVSTTSSSTVVPPKGSIRVELAIYCGLRDPYWYIDSSTTHYQDIRILLHSARKNGHTYRHICMPSKTGYKGFLVVEEAGEELVVGSDTRDLQLLLLSSMPNNPSIYNHARKEIDSNAASVECPGIARRKRYAPPYRPDIWNNNPIIRRNNNCYNYANTIITNSIAQPGRGSGQIFNDIANEAVKAAAVRDGMTVLNTAPNDPVPQAPNGNEHLVALVVDEGFDYHWYRLDNTGRWSHKPGQTRATNLDDSKRPINDPRRADLGTYEFVCFMKTNRFTVNII